MTHPIKIVVSLLIVASCIPLILGLIGGIVLPDSVALGLVALLALLPRLSCIAREKWALDDAKVSGQIIILLASLVTYINYFDVICYYPFYPLMIIVTLVYYREIRRYFYRGESVAPGKGFYQRIIATSCLVVSLLFAFVSILVLNITLDSSGVIIRDFNADLISNRPTSIVRVYSNRIKRVKYQLLPLTCKGEVIQSGRTYGEIHSGLMHVAWMRLVPESAIPQNARHGIETEGLSLVTNLVSDWSTSAWSANGHTISQKEENYFQEQRNKYGSLIKIFYASPYYYCEEKNGTKCENGGKYEMSYQFAGRFEKGYAKINTLFKNNGDGWLVKNILVQDDYNFHREDESIATPLENKQLWALATTAILSERNNMNVTSLAGFKITPTQTTNSKNLLHYWWGIDDKDGLLSNLQWLLVSGHRKDFNIQGKLLTKNSFLLFGLPNNKKEVLKKYWLLLGHKGIIGWDLSRYIFLCREGYAAGYLSEHEAWEKIMPIAKLIQQNFSSWAEFAENYMIGRRYWSEEEYSQRISSVEYIYENIKNNPNGPWKISWDTNLY